MKKILFRSFIIFAILLILALILLPGIAKRYAVNNSKELLGRQIQIEKLKLNYFTGTLKVFEFKMFEQNENDGFISFDTLIINLEPLQLFKDKIEIEQFYIQGLEVKILMKDSTFNFKDLIEFHSSNDDTLNQISSEKGEFKYAISNLELKEANLFFDNRNVDRVTHLQNLSFLIPFIGWDQEEKSKADVKFNFKQGGFFESKLNINPVNGEFDAAITINDLSLEPFYKYVVDYANINSFKGSLNTQILIEGNTNEAINSIISGVVEIHDFEMTDTQDRKFIGAKKVSTVLEKIDYSNNSYIIDLLKINESYTFFELDSISNNFYEIFKLSDNNAPIETTESDLYYAINHLEVNDGVLDYTDNLTGKPFTYHLSAIEITSDSILSDSKWVNINSTMLLNNRGALNAQLGIDPSNMYNLNLDIALEKFLLSDINIYTNYYTGHSIVEGDMFYFSNSKVTNGNIVSENKLLIKNVSLNNTKSGLYSLPLKFALFLLKDKNGDVNLDIPVRGDLNDPRVNVGKIVWNTFKNLIVKTVASPVNFLAGLVDGDPKELESIKFTYLDSVPTQKQYKQLDKILELEQKKPGLKIEMTYYVDVDLQKRALAKAEVGKMYFNETQKDYLKDTKGFENFVNQKIPTDSSASKERYLSLINRDLLNNIQNKNTQSLMDYLSEYIQMANDSTKIIIKKSTPMDSGNKGSHPLLKINYSMLD